MASKKPAPADKAAPQAEAPARARAPQPDPRDEIIAQQARQLAAMEERMVALEQVATDVQLLPPEETPVFEVGPGGYYSADDVLYIEGVQVEDITGRMPLNEQLIPLNEAADRRMDMYLRNLPQHGTPSHEFVLEAAYRHLGDLAGSAEDRADFFAKVLEDAATIRMKQLGLMPGNDGVRQAAPRPAARASAVPIMSNTRIRHDASPLGHTPLAPVARGVAQTRVRAPGAAPASKAAPPISGVHTTNIGRAGAGATAA